MTITLQQFNYGLLTMAILAIVVFIALYFINAGYGQFQNKKWGFTINNKIGWCLMEAHVFILMFVLWALSDRKTCTVTNVFFVLFQIHYFNRAFVFPFLIRGKGKTPVLIMFLAMCFNTSNALMQGGFIFYFSPIDRYSLSWLSSPQFIVGMIVFFCGMLINFQSDSIIRNLRKPRDNNHYLPKEKLFKYVTSANYFGEFIEWTGFAILTWSLSGAVFALWTFANLAPRSNAIWKKYNVMFPEEHVSETKKRIIPFIY